MLQSKAQNGFERKPDIYNYIDYQPLDPRIKIVAQYAKGKFAGSQQVAIVLQNLTDSKLQIKLDYTVIGYSGPNTKAEIGCCGNGITLKPNQIMGGEINWMGFSYSGKCTLQTGDVFKDKYGSKGLNCISSIEVQLISIENVTEKEAMAEAAKKLKEEQRIAEKKAAEEKRIEDQKKRTELKEAEEKKLAEEKKVAEQKKQAEMKTAEEKRLFEQQQNTQAKNSSSNYTSTQGNGSNNNTSNFSGNQNSNSFVSIKSNGGTVQVPVNSDYLDRSKYTDNQWSQIQSQLAQNRELVKIEKTKEIQRQQEAAKYAENLKKFNEAQEKVANEAQDRLKRFEQAQILQQQKDEYIRQAGTDLGVAIVGVANIFAEKAAKKRAAREAAANAAAERAERIRLKEEVEKERKALQLEFRESLFSQYPDVKLPLSSEKVIADDLYFFAYFFDKTKIQIDYVTLFTTPVFKIHRYGDGTWPYKNELTEKLSKVNDGKIFNVVGYFLSKDMAEEQRKLFTEDAAKYRINNTDAKLFEQKPVVQKSASMDFWGNPIKKDMPIDSLEGESNKTGTYGKLDFWGNPIKNNN